MQVCLIPVLPIHLHTEIPYPSVVHSRGEPCSASSARCLFQYSCSTQLFSTQVCFWSALRQMGVSQCRCLPQVCFLPVLADVFSTGSLPCRCVPRRCLCMKDSRSGSAPNRSASYHRVATPRVSPHLCGLTDVTAAHVGVPSCTSARPLLCLFRVTGLGSRYRCARGAAPPPAWLRPLIAFRCTSRKCAPLPGE